MSSRVVILPFSAMNPISSPSNPTVKLLRSLMSAKEVREHGLFLAEGVRAIEDGLRAGFTPTHCLYNRDLLNRTERGAALLHSLTDTTSKGNGAPPLEAEIRALEAAGNTQNPQGVVAAFPVPHWEPPTKSNTELAVICDAVQDPGNLGTILRTAEAAGANAAWLSPECVYAFSPKVVRAAMGAHFRLPIYVDVEWPRLLSQIESAGVPRSRVFVTEASAHDAYDLVDWSIPAAVVISNEAHGLSVEAVNALGGSAHSISIPMLGGTESLNASVAAAVVLFEAARQRRVHSVPLGAESSGEFGS